MARIAFYHDTRRSFKDGSPLRLFVHNKRGSAIISLDIRLTPEQWEIMESTMRCVPPTRWDTLTQFVYDQKVQAGSALLQLRMEVDVDAIDPKELRDRIVARMAGATYQPPQPKARSKDLFVNHYRLFASTRPAKSTQALYATTLNKIRVYDPDIESKRFEDIRRDWLTGFDTFMTRTGVSPNIRNQYFRNIRAVFNDAIAEEITENYPFRKFKMPKLEETKKRSLGIDDIKAIRDCPCSGHIAYYRDLFLLSFYLIGLSMTDVLHAKRTDIVRGRLEIRRQKTGKPLSIKIQPEAQAIIDRYSGKDWLVSPLDSYKESRDVLQHMNKALRHLGQTYNTSAKAYEGEPLYPELTSYVSRHSWATIATQLDIPMETVGRALGHSWVDRTVTSIYIKYDLTKLDAANRKVLDALL